MSLAEILARLAELASEPMLTNTEYAEYLRLESELQVALALRDMGGLEN